MLQHFQKFVLSLKCISRFCKNVNNLSSNISLNIKKFHLVLSIL